ncbi:MAG: MarR family winged helix-turn-helix transcriptional regulator [Tagaea sp.]
MTQAPRKSLVTDARRALGECPAAELRRASRLADRLLDARLRGLEMTAAQFGLLTLIAASRDDTMAGLAGRGNFDLSTLSRNLAILERDGLVEVAAIEADRRKRAVWLTETGARRLEKALPVWRATRHELDALARSLSFSAGAAAPARRSRPKRRA